MGFKRQAKREAPTCEYDIWSGSSPELQHLSKYTDVIVSKVGHTRWETHTHTHSALPCTADSRNPSCENSHSDDWSELECVTWDRAGGGTNWLQVCAEAVCLLFWATGIYSIFHMRCKKEGKKIAGNLVGYLYISQGAEVRDLHHQQCLMMTNQHL